MGMFVIMNSLGFALAMARSMFGDSDYIMSMISTRLAHVLYS